MIVLEDLDFLVDCTKLLFGAARSGSYRERDWM